MRRLPILYIHLDGRAMSSPRPRQPAPTTPARWRFDGQRLEAMRRHRGEQHAHLALATGKSTQTVRLYERGAIAPPAATICRLAQHLGVAPGALFTLTQLDDDGDGSKGGPA